MGAGRNGNPAENDFVPCRPTVGQRFLRYANLHSIQENGKLAACISGAQLGGDVETLGDRRVDPVFQPFTRSGAGDETGGGIDGVGLHVDIEIGRAAGTCSVVPDGVVVGRHKTMDGDVARKGKRSRIDRQRLDHGRELVVIDRGRQEGSHLRPMGVGRLKDSIAHRRVGRDIIVDGRAECPLGLPPAA